MVANNDRLGVSRPVTVPAVELGWQRRSRGRLRLCLGRTQRRDGAASRFHTRIEQGGPECGVRGSERLDVGPAAARITVFHAQRGRRSRGHQRTAGLGSSISPVLSISRVNPSASGGLHERHTNLPLITPGDATVAPASGDKVAGRLAVRVAVPRQPRSGRHPLCTDWIVRSWFARWIAQELEQLLTTSRTSFAAAPVALIRPRDVSIGWSHPSYRTEPTTPMTLE